MNNHQKNINKLWFYMFSDLLNLLVYWFFLSAHNMGKSKSHTCLVCCSMTKPIHKSVFILLETIFSVCLLKAGRSTPYHPRKQHYCDKKFCTINFIVAPYIVFLFITWRGRCNDLCTKQDNNKSLLGVKCPGAWSEIFCDWPWIFKPSSLKYHLLATIRVRHDATQTFCPMKW